MRRRVWCHSDYGPYNIIWDHRTLTPIDFAGAGLDVPLADVTYLIHRLEMLPLRYPWRRWPLVRWRRACLRGYGMPKAESSPVYRALMARFLLSRLKKIAQQGGSRAASWYAAWCYRWTRKRLEYLVAATR